MTLPVAAEGATVAVRVSGCPKVAAVLDVVRAAVLALEPPNATPGIASASESSLNLVFMRFRSDRSGLVAERWRGDRSAIRFPRKKQLPPATLPQHRRCAPYNHQMDVAGTIPRNSLA